MFTINTKIMKKLFFYLLYLTFIANLSAQQGINYKAVISDNGHVLQNQSVQVQFTILKDGSINVYQETFNPTTDENGIIILNIGEGNEVSGNFSAIDWTNEQFLKVDIDTGSGWTDMGTTAFKFVPYAKYATYAENGNGAKEIGDLSDAKFVHNSSLYLGLNSGFSDDGNEKFNVGVGKNSLFNNTSGNHNTAIGSYSQYYNMIGDSNTSVGYQALIDNTSGEGNVAIGTVALASNTTGNSNVAMGNSSLNRNSTGKLNVACGSDALRLNTEGNYNVAIGEHAGFSSLGDNNIFIGPYAGYYETGSHKLYIENSNSTTPLIGGNFSTDEVTINGTLAVVDGTQGVDKVLTSDANGKASWQTPIAGVKELNDLSDAFADGQSVYVGYNSGTLDDNSNYNAALGYQTMRINTSGRQNAALGAQTLTRNTTGSYNVSLGSAAMYNNIEGNYNVAIGEQAGFSCIGDGNVFIGSHSGNTETGSNKLYIENSISSTPLIGGDFSTDEVIINGSLNVTGNIEGKVTASHSGDADMKAYLFGSVGIDGVTLSSASSSGFTTVKKGTGDYRITSSGLNIYSATVTLKYGFIGFVSIEKFTGYFDVKTFNVSGIAEDRGFDFIVFQK